MQASSRCSSGKGYICDSEGDDDKASDAGSVLSTNPTNDGLTTNDTSAAGDRKDGIKTNNLSETSATTSVEKMDESQPHSQQGQTVCQTVFNPPASLDEAAGKANNGGVPHTVSNFVMPKPTSQPLQPIVVTPASGVVGQNMKEKIECTAINANQNVVDLKDPTLPTKVPAHLQPLASTLHHIGQAGAPPTGMIVPKEESVSRASPGGIKVKNLAAESESIMPSAVKPSAVKPELKEPGVVPLGLPTPMPLTATNFRPGFPSFSPFAPYAVSNNGRPPLSLPPGVPPNGAAPPSVIPVSGDNNAPLTIDDSSNSNSSSRASPRVIAGSSIDGPLLPTSMMPKYVPHQSALQHPSTATGESSLPSHLQTEFKSTASPVQKR